MKSLLAGLLVIAAVCGAQAASTDTIKDIDAKIAVVDQQLAEQLAALYSVKVTDATPEQKTVEIHMAANQPMTAVEAKRRGKSTTLPFRSGTCSGAFIGDEGEIITARHCVDGFDSFEVQTNDHRLYTAVVIATSTTHDLAIIRIDRNNTPYFRLADSTTRGEKVTILGSPLGLTDTLSTGVIARDTGDVLLLDCSALPGNSGGPVFNANNELVGILNAGYIVMFGVTHLNQAQSLDAVRFFIREVSQRYPYGRR